MIIMKSYFTNNPAHLDRMCRIVAGEDRSNVSLRLIHHYITAYARDNDVRKVSKTPYGAHIFDPHNKYKSTLKNYKTHSFDAFKRISDKTPKFTFRVGEVRLETTMSQLIFFWFLFEKGILESLDTDPDPVIDHMSRLLSRQRRQRLEKDDNPHPPKRRRRRRRRANPSKSDVDDGVVEDRQRTANILTDIKPRTDGAAVVLTFDIPF